jgi:histidinol-phosphate aminotransferase
MYKLPEKLDKFTPYEPLTGEYKIRLDVNESFIEISPDKIAKAVENVKFNRYPDPYASEAVGAFARLFGIEPRHVTAGNGSDELIGIIAAGLLEKGDKVAVFTPDFPMYSFYSRLYELEVVQYHECKNKDYKCVMFSNPCNPTSLGIEKSEIQRFVRRTDAIVVLDEAYMDFWCESQSMIREAHEYDNLIVLRTCSKSVALAGIRVGFAVANERTTCALKTVKSPFNVNSLSQAIACEILSDPDGYKKSIEMIKDSIMSLKTELEKLNIFEEIYDTKTNFVYVRTSKNREIYEYLLSKSIAVRCFEGHLRICAGTAEENRELIEELKTWKLQTK